MRLRVGPVLAAAITLGGPTPAALRAQLPADSSPVRGRDDTEAQRLFGRLMSPFCPGLTLAQCPSPGADSLRQDIRARLALGEPPRAITASFAADWGEQMLGAPPVRDWGVLLWTLPGLLLLAGAVALTAWLRKLRRPAHADSGSTAPAPVSPPIEPSQRARLDAELEAFERRL